MLVLLYRLCVSVNCPGQALGILVLSQSSYLVTYVYGNSSLETIIERKKERNLPLMLSLHKIKDLLIACFFILFSLVPMQRLFSLSKESGRNAAKYIIKQFPQYFDKTFVEPNVPCLMPEILTPQIEGLSEEALKERIHLRRVKDSVDLFDQLVQAGTPVSLETTNSLLDLLCFYGDGESTPEKEEEKENLEEPGASRKQSQRGSHLFIDSRENNNAERIFKIMPERNAHSYCTMIRGMVKNKLFPVEYNSDVHTFNALITAVPYLKERFLERWELVFLNHMAQQEVQPNLLTFNALLKTLRRCGGVGKSMSLLVIKEMEALDIGKRTRMVIIFLCHLQNSIVKSSVANNTVIPSCREFCCDLKDIKLACRLNKAMEKGDNWKFLDVDRLNVYWSKFFSLLCMMEQIDVVLKWYKEMSPSVFYPTPKNILDLLQALDAANHLEVIPSVWEDMKQLGFNRRHDLLEELLSLMSREQHPHEIQLAFAKCAEDIKAAHEQTGREQAPLEWTGHALGSVAVLFSRAGRTQDAWYVCGCRELLVMNEFLNCAKQTNCPDEAIKLVKLAASLDLPSSQRLKSRTEKEFELSENIKSDSDSSDSDSDSDSDRD
uniref:Small ribosomal subunit protein mS39 n=1 Tax=Strix occidentalis caurina TaxID=311401 RepID=A0A8D0G123_STROC